MNTSMRTPLNGSQYSNRRSTPRGSRRRSGSRSDTKYVDTFFSPKTPRSDTRTMRSGSARGASGRFWQTVYTPFDERGRSAIDQQHQMIENDDEMIIGETDRSRGRDSKRNAIGIPTSSLSERTKTPLASIKGGLVDGDDDSNSITPRRTLPPDLVSVGSSRPQNGADSERTVTVYGFPRDQFSTVLRVFRRHGKIESFELGEGNWVNLRYETAQQAKLALSRDREMIEGSIMIGVVRCDRDFRLQQKRRRTSSLGVSRHRTSSDLNRPYALENLAKQYSTNHSWRKLTVPRDSNSTSYSMRKRDGLCQRLMRWFFNM